MGEPKRLTLDEITYLENKAYNGGMALPSAMLCVCAEVRALQAELTEYQHREFLRAEQTERLQAELAIQAARGALEKARVLLEYHDCRANAALCSNALRLLGGE